MLDFIFSSPWALYLGSALYTVQAGAYLYKGDHGMAVVFAAYVVANGGLIYSFSK
jgi:hypothetical protein